MLLGQNLDFHNEFGLYVRLGAILFPISASPLLFPRLAQVTRSWPVASNSAAEGGAGAMRNPIPTTNNATLLTRVSNMIATVQSWVGRLGAFAVALLDKVPFLGVFLRSRVASLLLMLVIGFGAGMTWDSWGDSRNNSNERIKAMSLALSTARRNLDKLASDLSRLEVQSVEAQQRRPAR